MKLQLLGCSHHASSLELRERLAFAPNQLGDALRKLQQRFPNTEAVLLSTCNRVELYVATSDRGPLPDHQQLIAFLASYHHLEANTLSRELYYYQGREAVRHLFLVAASLDSMVVGEAQILSQVKQAFAAAEQEQSHGPVTHHVFQAAYRVAKRVANETEISRRRVSIPSVAVSEYAKQLFETFQDKNILLLGAGEMGEETLRYLKDEGAQTVAILNRNPERAKPLAEKLGASVDDWQHLENRITWADLIVSTTASRETIVTVEQFETVQKQRAERLLFVLDLAVPRDFDPRIAQFSNVYLYCIDDLQAICDKNRKAREREWPKAARIVDEETVRCVSDWYHRATAPTIQRLHQQADQVKNDEIQRLLNKLGNIDPHSEKEIKRAFDRLTKKLLHPPLESLRDEARTGPPHGLLAALRHLFQISE
ncbi:MAG: glutamyl-tRNA reductase [Pirellulaceae bacterium]